MKLEELEKYCTYWNRGGENTIPIYQVIEVAQNILPKLIAVAKAAQNIVDTNLEKALEDLEGKRKKRTKSPEQHESKMQETANMCVMLHNNFLDDEFREFAIEKGFTLTKMQILENLLAEFVEISLSEKEKEHLEKCVEHWENTESP